MHESLALSWTIQGSWDCRLSRCVWQVYFPCDTGTQLELLWPVTVIICDVTLRLSVRGTTRSVHLYRSARHPEVVYAYAVLAQHKASARAISLQVDRLYIPDGALSEVKTCQMSQVLNQYRRSSDHGQSRCVMFVRALICDCMHTVPRPGQGGHRHADN